MCLLFEKVPARLVLYLLCLNGMTVTFIMRLVINLTILAMVKDKPEDESFNATETVCNVNSNNTHVAPIDYGGTLEWSIDEQFCVLSSFYWTYLISQPICGIIVQKIGAKKTFGWSLFLASMSILCIPFASYVHYILVVILEGINGISQGCTWPAVYSTVGIWIPIQERSRFLTCFQGLSLGTMLANVLAGFIIAKFGWVYVFYCVGTLGLLSAVLWYSLMHEKPEQHPRISKEELCYIEKNREQNVHSENNIPWSSILTSIPVWVIGISAFGRMWVNTIMQVYGPLYLKTVIGLTVEMNGLLLGVSSLVAFLSALLFSFISDKIETHKLISLVNNRKLFSGIGQVIPGVLAVAICYGNCNIPLIIATWFLIQLLITAGFSGNMANIVDIAPNYAGPVTSFIQIILLSGSVLSPLMAKILLKNESTSVAWKYIFFISSGIIIGTYTVFAILASGKIQEWDLPKKSSKVSDHTVKKGLLKDEREQKIVSPFSLASSAHTTKLVSSRNRPKSYPKKYTPKLDIEKWTQKFRREIDTKVTSRNELKRYVKKWIQDLSTHPPKGYAVWKSQRHVSIMASEAFYHKHILNDIKVSA
ncbi:hypothetical protein FQR65_LT05447 [Abscondita terminalis]|nr:hypothetical protein FQR65_LT05447 [Abscondita terminalis]